MRGGNPSVAGDFVQPCVTDFARRGFETVAANCVRIDRSVANVQLDVLAQPADKGFVFVGLRAT